MIVTRMFALSLDTAKKTKKQKKTQTKQVLILLSRKITTVASLQATKKPFLTLERQKYHIPQS